MAGVFGSPVLGPVNISQAFGNPNTSYAAGHHTGMDFSVGMRTPVRSVLDGRVVTSKYSKDYGNYIVIEHPNGLTTLYAHLSSRNYMVGATIKTGAVIGTSGNTGNSSGPHLHFEVRQGTGATGGGQYRNAIDPVEFFSVDALKGLKSTSSTLNASINKSLGIPNTAGPVYRGQNPNAKGAPPAPASPRGATSGDNPAARGAPVSGGASAGAFSTSGTGLSSGYGGQNQNVTVIDNTTGGGAGGGEVSEKPLTKQDFGFTSAFLKANPEINQKVEEAIKNGWTVAQFQGRVIDTAWYKARTKAQREYDMAVSSDPASIKDAENKMLTDLTRLAGVMGVSSANLQTEAKTAVRNGMSADEYIGFLSTRANYSEEQVGRAGIVQQQVLEYADAYGITASPDEVNRIMRDTLSTGAEWSEKLGSYEDHFRERAKTLYAGVAKQIDGGATVKDILDPYLSRAADMLGKTKETMSTADGMWNRAITGEQPLTLQEWEKQVRTDKSYKWSKGPQAMEWARGVGDEFMKAFGARS